MRCNICGNVFGGVLCSRCGYDASQDREQFPTFTNDGKSRCSNGELRNVFYALLIDQIAAAKRESSTAKRPQIAVLKKASVGDVVYFGSYVQNATENGRKETIEWIVLAREGDRILVISKYALDCRKYNLTNMRVTWESCSLRKWLNGAFLNTAFSAAEQAMIPAVTVSADENPSFDSNPGNSTTDQVFLLSIAEAEKYVRSNNVQQCQGTAYCYAQGTYKGSNEKCIWWLRSAGFGNSCAALVDVDGYVNDTGDLVSCNDIAVRPALWINVGS